MNKELSVLFAFISISCCTAHQQLFYEEDSHINLFAFIGKKISITEFSLDERYNQVEIDSLTGDTISQKAVFLDLGFDAKYEVVANVFNSLKADTVDFIIFDHYGRPLFEHAEYVLLYVSWSADENTYYLQKYQFDQIILNRKKEWRGINGEAIRALFLRKKHGSLYHLF